MKKKLALIFIVAGLALPCMAETFVVSDGSTNSIVVATNQAIIIDYVDSNSPYPLLRVGNTLLGVNIKKGMAFAGPAELIFVRSTLVNFHRIQTSAMTTLLLKSNQTSTITVPANKTLKIFATDLTAAGKISVTQGAQSRVIDNDNTLTQGWEFTGPLTIALSGFHYDFEGFEYRQVFSFYFTEDFVQVTAEGYLRGPSGTYEVLVEKSSDLSQWLPSMVQSTVSSDSRAFYRLRIQK